MSTGAASTPHTVMLAVHCKRGDNIDMKGPVRSYVQKNYGNHDASECSDDLEAMHSWRSSIIGQNGSPESLRDILCKYFRALSAMEARFPVSDDKDHIGLSFVWYDAFKPSKKTSQANLHFEKTSVLFNLGAVLSQMAISSDRSDPQGVKDACRYFQEAAGAFAYLREHEAMKVENPKPIDITPECTAMLEKLMLAQAQEIFYEKAIADGKTNAVVAKLGKQVAILYEEVHRAITGNAVLAGHFDKSWSNHTLGKSQFYDTQARYRQSLAHHEKEEIALAITYMRQAIHVLGDAKKLVKAVHEDMADNLRMLEKECMAKLSKLEKENLTVYLERIPSHEEVPKITGAQLVKSTTPPCLADGKVSDAFSTVVPQSSAKALSKYSGMVDEICREQLDRLAQASDDARIKLREWELPELLVALESGSAAGLPDHLRQELEEIERQGGGLAHLKGLSSQISENKSSAQAQLMSVEEQLNTEAKEDNALREQYKDRWTRSPSHTLTTTLWDRIAGYRANLQQAAASDQKIQQKLEANAERLEKLSLEWASSNMPRLQQPMMSVDDMEPAAVISNLRGALRQLDELGSQRAGLEESLKAMKEKDNILPKLMASSSDHEALFDAEIAKYNPIRDQVTRNCSTQDQVLRDIAQNYNKFVTLFGVADWRSACSTAAADVRNAVGLYRELRDNLSEGARFYLQLQEVITSLSQHCGDFCLTRRIQRDDLVEELQRKNQQASQAEADRLAALRISLQPPVPHGGPAPPSGAAYPQLAGNAAAAPPAPPHPHGQGYSSYAPGPPPQGGPGYGPPPPPPGQPLPPGYAFQNPYHQAAPRPSDGDAATSSNPMFRQ
uniref:Programmed cell death 6-interacting protein n=1 Tax=Tetraselmis sp. GSL018 TaxID=582737 RepID=A0A061S6K1_9CHLO